MADDKPKTDDKPKQAELGKSGGMKAERWNEIKAALFKPESNTQEAWCRMARDLGQHVEGTGSAVKDSAARQKEIAAMEAAASKRRGAVHQGRGAWFLAIVDLFEMAKPPEGCASPTEDEILSAREPDDIRAQLAARYDQNKVKLDKDAVEAKLNA